MFIKFLMLANIFAQVQLQEVIVKEGDTLWGIANYWLKDPRAWDQILKYNKLPTTDLTVALPGMKLLVPIVLIKEELRAAYLIYLLNKAEYRRKNTVKWESASLNLSLFQDDSLHTFENSKARIKYYTGEILSMDENTFVTFRPEAKLKEAELVSGEVEVTNAKVISMKTEVTPKTSKTQYKAKLLQDKTLVVQVYKDAVDVESQGKKISVPEGFGSLVKYLEPPQPAIPLPKLPEIVKTIDPDVKIDVNKPQLAFSQKDLTISFSKQEKLSDTKKILTKPEFIKSYRLQIANDEKFNNLLWEKIYNIDEKVVLKNIITKDGQYWWRSSLIDSLGLESKPSQPQVFYVDLTPPELKIDSPPDNSTFNENLILIKGKTETGSFLKINDIPVTINTDGSFLKAVLLASTTNYIRFFCEDSNGNQTKSTLTIFCKNPQVIEETKQQQEEKEKIEKKLKEQAKKMNVEKPALFTIAFITLSIIASVFLILSL